jgi:hypothetical protein
MNTCADIHGGGDNCDHSEKVAVVNNLGKEKPRLNQSTIFLST